MLWSYGQKILTLGRAYVPSTRDHALPRSRNALAPSGLRFDAARSTSPGREANIYSTDINSGILGRVLGGFRHEKSYCRVHWHVSLVFIGCRAVVVGGMASGPTAITELAIALAFGLSIVAMAYGIGQISGSPQSGSQLWRLCRRKNDA